MSGGVMRFLSAAADVFLPRLCPSCHIRLAPNEEMLCPACFATCSRPDDKLIEKEFRKKFFAAAEVDAFLPLFIFEYGTPVQHLVHSIKYGGMFRNAVKAGELAGAELLVRFPALKAALIVPVPLFRTRKSQRGFNQSDYFAKGISLATSIPVKPNALVRVRDTLTQTHLNKLERKDNMRGAFAIGAYQQPPGTTIVLVDDVVTTGATVSECASVLKRAGAGMVIAVSIGLAE